MFSCNFKVVILNQPNVYIESVLTDFRKVFRLFYDKPSIIRILNYVKHFCIQVSDKVAKDLFNFYVDLPTVNWSVQLYHFIEIEQSIELVVTHVVIDVEKGIVDQRELSLRTWVY